MRAVQITRFGGPEVLEVVDVPEPTPADGQQVYDVSAAGINSPTPTTRCLESHVGALAGRTGGPQPSDEAVRVSLGHSDRRTSVGACWR